MKKGTKQLRQIAPLWTLDCSSRRSRAKADGLWMFPCVSHLDQIRLNPTKSG